MSSRGPSSPARQTSRDEHSTKKVASEAAHTLFIESTTVLWMIYRSTLSRPARWIVPDHTRDAFFQAFCDLRTNTPKDRKWLRRHLNALKPHTAKGWLALAATLMVAASALASLLCIVGALLTMLLYSTLFVSVLAGLALGTLLTVLSVTMLVAATMAGISAACIGTGYSTLEIASQALGWANRHILRPASRRVPVLSEDAQKLSPDPPLSQQQGEPLLREGSDSQLSSESTLPTSANGERSPEQESSQFAEAKSSYLQHVNGLSSAGNGL